MNIFLALIRSPLEREKVVLLLDEVAAEGAGAWHMKRMSSLRTLRRSRRLGYWRRPPAVRFIKLMNT
jgi:hypothetical protein